MKFEPCSKVCHECGFLRGSKQGVLKPELGLFEVLAQRKLFPCHLQLKPVTGFENKGVEFYAATQEVFKVCRGYVISMLISGVPPANKIWAELYDAVKDDIDPNVMPLAETVKYHTGIQL